MEFLQLFIFVGICVAAVAGHMCLLSPPQRGTMMGLNKPAAPDCYLTKGPCGGRQPRSFPVMVPGGQNFTFSFQKNLDHYNSSTPGYFSISVTDTPEMGFHEIARVPDQGEASLHIYVSEVTLPKVSKASLMTVQARYVTNNSGIEDAIFYQCSNIIVYPTK